MVGSWRWEQTCTHTNTHVHTHKLHIHAHTHMHMHTLIYTHAQTTYTHNTQPCTHINNQHIHKCIQTHIYIHKQVCTCAQIYTNTHMHMHTKIIINLSGPRCVTSQIEHILVLISGDHAYTYIIMYLDYTRQPQRLLQLGILHGKFYTALWVTEQISIQLIDVRRRMVYQ